MLIPGDVGISIEPIHAWQVAATPFARASTAPCACIQTVLAVLAPRHKDLELTASQKRCTQLLLYSLVLLEPCHMPEM